jgi:triosephosphate isomerase (TIM)
LTREYQNWYHIVMKYLVANHKAYKTYKEIEDWMNKLLLFCSKHSTQLEGNITIIIAPTTVHLSFCKMLTEPYNFSFLRLAAQDIVIQKEGSFTGDTSAESLVGIADYVIVNHLERTANHNESQKVGIEKAQMLLDTHITPIMCVRDGFYFLPPNMSMIAYEPQSAIGSGHNLAIEDVLEQKKRFGITKRVFLYGGSVTSENIHEYAQSSEIDGLLIGHASLDIEEFCRLINAFL